MALIVSIARVKLSVYLLTINFCSKHSFNLAASESRLTNHRLFAEAFSLPLSSTGIPRVIAIKVNEGLGVLLDLLTTGSMSSSNLVTDDCRDFIKLKSQENRPFLVYWPTVVPHGIRKGMPTKPHRGKVREMGRTKKKERARLFFYQKGQKIYKRIPSI
ncbi:MAG: hypothetical protein ACI9YH_000328 [Colwellia sp.]|jgi:hypothetical protein